MARPAFEARQKAQAIWPGASVHSRGKGWVKHQHPTNPRRRMQDTQVGARWHFGDGPYSDANEIDTAWQPTTGAWDYEMALNDFQTYARDTFNVGDIFEFQTQGESLRFDPQSINWIDENNSRQQIAIKQTVTATVDDDKLIFTDAYGTGIHFQYQNQTSRLQKLVTIDSAANLPAVTLQGNIIHFEAEFSMSLSSGLDFYLDGELWERQNGVRVKTSTNVEVRDAATGTQVLWWLGLPRAYDAIDSPIIGEIEVRRQGGPASLFITIRIPKVWIDTAVFPIYIDPTIDPFVGASSDDAFERDSDGLTIINGGAHNSDDPGDYFGWRWTGVEISAGATINTAYLDLYYHLDAWDEPWHTIDFEDGSAPGTFTTATNNISGRTGTTETATHGDGSDIGAPGWLNTIQTAPFPELKDIIQELVDTYDYSSGSSMVARAYPSGLGDTSNDMGLYTYDQDSQYGAKLHIEYFDAATGPQINISPDANYVQVV